LCECFMTVIVRGANCMGARCAEWSRTVQQAGRINSKPSEPRLAHNKSKPRGSPMHAPAARYKSASCKAQYRAEVLIVLLSPNAMYSIASCAVFTRARALKRFKSKSCRTPHLHAKLASSPYKTCAKCSQIHSICIRRARSSAIAQGASA
jgi:hypothetical protein